MNNWIFTIFTINSWKQNPILMVMFHDFPTFRSSPSSCLIDEDGIVGHNARGEVVGHPVNGLDDSSLLSILVVH